MSTRRIPRGSRLGRVLVLGLAFGVLWAAVPRVPAFAASTTYYLASDGVPEASLASTAPTDAVLPNHDPGRDNLPGLVLRPTLFVGLLELDPAKYQKWSAPIGGVDIDGPVTFTFWSAADDFAADTRGTVRVGLYDCRRPTTWSCRRVAYRTYSPTQPWSPSGDWTEHTIGWNVDFSVPDDHYLMVKLVVGFTSETSLLFAYDAADYPSRLEVAAGPANEPPVTVDDAATTTEDAAVVVDVLTNDSDPDGGAVAVVAVGRGAAGSVVDNGDGTVTYTPDPDWNGVDSFAYTITDGTDTANGNVSVTVSAVNDAPRAGDDAAATDEDEPVVVEVLANDADVDGDPLVVTELSPPAEGDVILNRDGTITYTPPPDWSGRATMTYEVGDTLATDTATITVDVRPVNDAPVARADVASVPEDGGVTVDVLGNDTDIEGDALSVMSIDPPANGLAIDNTDGTITYVPDADWYGTDTFTYESTDGSLTDRAVVTVTVGAVNDAPTRGNIDLSLVEDTVVSFDPLAGADDVDGDPLTLGSLIQPAHATATLDADGTITVRPEPDWHGSTGFSYTVSDGVETATVAVVVDVAAVNDVPVAGADVAATVEDGEVVISVLANDSDVDGDALSLVGVAVGGFGTVTIEGDGVRYVPRADWHGVDTLRYTLSDGTVMSAGTIEVTVTPVNDAPEGNADAASTDEDVAVVVDVLANDADVDGDALSLVAVGEATLGSPTIVAGGVRYTPAADAYGVDTFTYTLSDASGLTATATVTVTVRPVNDGPAAEPDSAITDEDAGVRVDVLGNDRDADGDELVVTLVSPPAEGSVVVSEDGSITYTPAPDWHGETLFVYAVSDGAESAEATVEVTVRPVNDDPVAEPDAISVLEDGEVGFDPLANDRDVDGDELSLAAWTEPEHGSVEMVAGALHYVPDADYFGPDAFSYTVGDGQAGFAAATVAIEVGPVDDAPVARDDEASTPAGRPITIRVVSNDSDVDGDRLQIVSFGQGEHGAVTANGDGTLTYTPGPGFVGTDRFEYVVTDGTTAKTALVTLTREIDGAALVATSLTPAPPVIAQWAPAPSPSDVVADEVRDTALTLAVPAAAAAAAVGATMLAQSQTAAGIALRLGRLFLRRF